MRDGLKALADRLQAEPDWRRRREIALELGYTRDGRWYDTLVRALDDPDPAVRQAVILSLGRLGRPELVNELAKPKILAAEDAEVRRAAISVLGRVGGFAIVDAISQSLDDPEWTVRNEAIAAVGRLVDQFSEFHVPETAKVLVRVLPIDDRDVREKTIRALGSFGKSAVAVLADALDTKSELVRSGAAAALGLIRDPTTVPGLVRLLSDDSRQVRLAAIAALGNITSSKAIAPLIERLGDTDPTVREAAVESLERLGPACVVPLIEALDHAHLDVEIAAILRALGSFEDARALVPIMNHLGHTYMTVRWAAVDAAVRHGEAALPLLIDMLALNRVPAEPLVADARSHPNKRNRLRTIRALGELKDSKVVPALKEMGQEDDREIRMAVEEALRKIGSATWARASAAKALGFIRNPEGVPALIRHLRDPNSTVRLRVVRALMLIGDARASKPIAMLLKSEQDVEVREEIATALGTVGLAGPEAVSACIRALGDPSRSVRSNAARSLGRLASPRAAPHLVRALGDGYWSVSRDAENSIVNLGAKAVPSLVEALGARASASRLRAARILGSIGDPRAEAHLSRLLSTERDPDVRASAETALERLRSG